MTGRLGEVLRNLRLRLDPREDLEEAELDREDELEFADDFDERDLSLEELDDLELRELEKH